MDWLKLYEGSDTDPKWFVVAADCGFSRGTVFSVWVSLLLYANGNIKRGSIDGICCEAYDGVKEYEVGTTAKVIASLKKFGLIAANGDIAKWDERQTQTAAERSRKYRERRAEEKKGAEEMPITEEPETEIDSQNHTIVTNVTRVTLRGEERRGEEKEKDTEKENPQPPLPLEDDADNIKPQEIIALWNSTMPQSGFSRVEKATPKRVEKIKARCRSFRNYRVPATSRGFWQRLFATVRRSDFCRGENNRHWQADFDFVVQNDDTIAKIVEGKYDNREMTPLWTTQQQGAT